MAPIEPEFFNSNVKPIVLLSIYAGVTASLVALIAHRVFHAAHRALPPAMANRVRQGRRRRHILLYTALSLISLGVATYWRVQQVRQSYNVWAYERGYTVPGALWTDDTAKWEFGRWLQDTNFDDVWEIALEKSRRRWWTSQYFFSITIWSFFVSVEGRRRNIPYLWSFVVLNLLVGLSFAANLFFLAMLWTPVPFPSPDEDSTALIPTSPTGTKHAPARKTHSRKSSRSIQSPPPTTKPYLNRLSTAISSYVPSRAWAPHPFFSILPLLLSFLLNPLLSLSVNTPSFSTFLQLSLTIPPILTLLLPARPSQALSHFRTASILSLLLYVAHTFLAIVDPETTNTHRHSHLLPYLPIKVENHAPKSAVQRILTSSSDHPAIGKLAWDVILTFVSLAIWAGARGLSAGTILRSSGLASKSAISAATSAAESAKSALVDAVVTDEEPASPTRGSVRSRRPRRSSKLASEERQITEAGESGEAARDWKTTDKELDRVWLGEEESEEDWEVTALGWALGVVGGLGTAASSILGAEVVEN